ncbi:unnamed protein product [Kluyveromyces dobzhanskii CBS 2104]|uniref:WGS project CCBQ000000000 data, contig 00099 n=1 Tax=Kluyveromyces dobzhanskii CBS 2104 TaxID=1427455 RepID=A0A0A8L2E0_9SACH|nr:unnamed protein product [Kluyveromyces dobzhanskii CBS 2104]
MAFSREQFLNKVQSLDETQDSIVNTSKWILTLYEDSDKVAAAWSEYLNKGSISTKRKLLVIYLANDIVQQAKHKQVPNFDRSFGDVLPSALEKVYADFPTDLRAKVKRVVGIWKQRKVLSESVLKAINQRLDAAERSSPASSSSTHKSKEKVDKRWGRLSSVYDSIEQNQKNGATLRLRFDKSLEALDPTSVVYAENYTVISKIGNSVKESLQKSIDYRSTLAAELSKLITEQNDLLNKEQDSISEIDSILADKDPATIAESTNPNDADLLPTYENNEDDDEDDDSSDDSDEAPSKDKHTEPSNEQQDIASSSEKSSSEEPVPKKMKLEEPKDEGATPSSSSPIKNNTGAIASSIQDLLSRLAD